MPCGGIFFHTQQTTARPRTALPCHDLGLRVGNLRWSNSSWARETRATAPRASELLQTLNGGALRLERGQLTAGHGAGVI